MNEYEDLPCSVYAPNRVAFQPLQQINQSRREHSNLEANPEASAPLTPPSVQKEDQPSRVAPTRTVTASKPEEPSKVALEKTKKSCLTRNSTTNKPIPPHPALKKKTVAFGKTVNVSQTVEGTSRSAKRQANSTNTTFRREMSTKSPPRAEEIGGETAGEEPENWRKTMQEELSNIKEEMLEENKKRQTEVMSEMKNVMTEIMKEVLSKNGSSNREEKENMVSHPSYNRVERERQAPPPSKASIACQIFRREGRLNSDAIAILERTTSNNRIFRQQVDDALAEAEYEEKQCLYSPIPSTASRYRPDALMKETLTVERSIRVDNDNAMNAWSVDSRHFMNSAGNSPYTPMNDRGRYHQPEALDVPLHSTYQPGNSISYYPSAVDQQKNRKNNDYYVEHVSDHDDHPDDTSHHHIGESRAEKERRIREKYSKRK